LGAVTWMIKNPTKGFCVPDDLPHDKVLEVANPYLGPCPSVPSDWTPLKNRVDLWSSWGGAKRPSEDDMWQFGSFLV
jgi:homospermidine synthase